MVIRQLGQKRRERKGIILSNQFQPLCTGHVTMGSQNDSVAKSKGSRSPKSVERGTQEKTADHIFTRKHGNKRRVQWV
jgi:hypothetical protein